MPITVECPGCAHKQKFDDAKAGKAVTCKNCDRKITAIAAKTKLAPDEQGIKSGTPSGKKSKAGATMLKSVPTVKAAPDDDDEPRGRKRRRAEGDDDNDDDYGPTTRKRREKKGSGGTMMIVLGLGGLFVVLLLCGGVGVGGYFAFFRSNKPDEQIAQVVNDPPPELKVVPLPAPFRNPNPPIVNPNPFQPPPIQPPLFQQPEVLEPNDANACDRVLTMLKGPAQERGPALRWLRNANPNHARRSEVARQLDAYVDEELRNPFAFAGDFFPAYFRWATKDNVPTLRRMAENAAFNPSDNGRRQEAMIALGKLKEASAADLIASKLDNAFDGDAAYKALVEMGPAAEPAVCKMFNHPNGGARAKARDLLKAYNTTPDKILTQCIADLDSAEKDRRNAAMQYFTTIPVNPQRKAEVARALNKSIPTANFFFERDFAKVLEIWGTSENVPALIQRLDANKTGNEDVIRILGKTRDPIAVKAIARSLSSPFNQGAAKAALKEIGPAAEPAIVEAMSMTADGNARQMYVNTLGEIGTSQSLPALNQIAFRFQQDRAFVMEVQRAVKSIVQRGK